MHKKSELVFNHIKNTAGISNSLNVRIDEAIPEYLDDGWEDEFDDMWEAYEETGRDAAHDQVLQAVIVNTCHVLGVDLDLDQHCEVLEMSRSDIL